MFHYDLLSENIQLHIVNFELKRMSSDSRKQGTLGNTKLWFHHPSFSYLKFETKIPRNFALTIFNNVTIPLFLEV